jgi:hypothetical protein
MAELLGRKLELETSLTTTLPFQLFTTSILCPLHAPQSSGKMKKMSMGIWQWAEELRGGEGLLGAGCCFPLIAF